MQRIQREQYAVVLGLDAKLRDQAIHVIVIWANRIDCRVLTLSSTKWRKMARLSSQQLLQLLSTACSPSQSTPQTAVVFQPVGGSNVTLTQTSQGQLHRASVSVPHSVSHCDTLSLKFINPKKKKEYKAYQLDSLRQVTGEEKLRECIFNAVEKDVVRYDLDSEVGYYEGMTRMSFPSDEFQVPMVLRLDSGGL